MTDPKQNIETTLKTLFEREGDYEKACLNLAEAEHDFKMKYAEEIKKAKGTVKEKESEAMIQCKSEHKAYIVADAVKGFTKEKLRNVQQALSARQSILSADTRTNFGYATSREII